ncbi:MAG: hypothetical protein EZS28_054603, partial [Streblomastix strix]
MIEKDLQIIDQAPLLVVMLSMVLKKMQPKALSCLALVLRPTINLNELRRILGFQRPRNVIGAWTGAREEEDNLEQRKLFSEFIQMNGICYVPQNTTLKQSIQQQKNIINLNPKLQKDKAQQEQIEVDREISMIVDMKKTYDEMKQRKLIQSFSPT